MLGEHLFQHVLILAYFDINPNRSIKNNCYRESYFLGCGKKMAAVSSFLKSMGKKLDIREVTEIQNLLKSNVSGELPDYMFPQT